MCHAHLGNLSIIILIMIKPFGYLFGLEWYKNHGHGDPQDGTIVVQKFKLRKHSLIKEAYR